MIETRTGRPKAQNPKNLNVTVRFDAETYQRINEYSAKEQISKAEIVRVSVKEFLKKERKEE